MIFIPHLYLYLCFSNNQHRKQLLKSYFQRTLCSYFPSISLSERWGFSPLDACSMVLFNVYCQGFSNCTWPIICVFKWLYWTTVHQHTPYAAKCIACLGKGPLLKYRICVFCFILVIYLFSLFLGTWCAYQWSGGHQENVLQWQAVKWGKLPFIECLVY